MNLREYNELKKRMDNLSSGRTSYDSSHPGNTLPDRLIEDYNSVTGNGSAFSPNNPAYIQMQFAQNKEELLQLRQEAIEWEINNSNLQEQRAYEEQYNHPLAQMQRLRQAGANPDLSGLGGSGGVSAGTASTATMQPAAVDSMPTSSTIAGVVFQGMESAGSFLTSLTSSLNAGIDFAQKVASFDSITSLNKGSALQKEIETLGDIASMIPADLSDDEFAQMVRSFVPGVDDSFVSRVSAFNKSPQAQEAYNRYKYLANDASAKASAYTPAMLTGTYRMMAFTDNLSAQLSVLRGVLDAELFKAEFNVGTESIEVDSDGMISVAVPLSDTEPFKQEKRRRRNVRRLEAEMSERNLSSYLSLANVIDTLCSRASKDANDLYEQYQKTPSPALWRRYVSAQSLVMSMETLRSEEMRQVFSLFQKHQLNESISDISMDSFGNLKAFNTDFNTRYYDYYNLLFGDPNAKQDTPLTDGIGSLSSLVKTLFTGGKSQ